MLAPGQKIEPVKVAFGTAGMAALDKHVAENIRTLKNSWKEFHEEKLPHYKKIYDGTPRDETKSFPWRNASNIVIQVVGQHVDTLQARIIASIYELTPLWPISVLGKSEPSENAEEKREALEEFLSHAGLSPDELDFYRTECLWCSDTLKYGLGVIKGNVEEDLEQQVINIAGVETPKPLLKSNGPQVEKLRLEDFMCTMTAGKIEKAAFITHRARLTKYDLEERKFQGRYDKAAVDEMLKHPDMNGPSPAMVEEYSLKGLDLQDLYSSGEWHVFECWFPYWHNGKKFRIIHTYHPGTEKTLRSIYNFYPENETPFITARLGYKEDGILGKGFSELLEDYQEEITAGHNQRVDNRTIANTSIIRVAPNSRFDSQFSFYPNMTIPAGVGEIEAIQFGAVYPSSVNEEMLSLKLAEDRSGVGASTTGGGGVGSGTVGKTSGAYTANGTAAILQDGSANVGANITDFKYAHMKAGRLFANLFAHFGTNGKEYLFGKNAELVVQALEAISSKKLGFDVKAATASINKEVEKQNYLLLTGILQRHYTAIGQMIQAANSQQIDPILKDYLIQVIKGSDQLMGKVLSSFGIEDKSRILPEPKIAPTTTVQGAASGQPAADGAVSQLPVGETNATQGSVTSPNVIQHVGNYRQVP